MHGPVSIADRLADRFTFRSIDLLRFDAHLRRKALVHLRRLERELLAQIAASDPYGVTRTAFQQARLDALLKQTQATIATAYRAMRTEQERQLAGLAAQEDLTTRSITNGVVGAELMTVAVGETQLARIVDDTLIEGAPTRTWWDRQTTALQTRFGDQMRRGMLRSETIDQLTRRVRGTRANQFTDGIMQATRAQAEALVRTSVNGVANGARMATFQANEDVVRGVAAHVTLDLRTSEICIARAGACWDLDGKPLPESTRQEPFPGYPPWHWGERTVLTAVLKSLADVLGVVGQRKQAALRRLPEGTQASMNGQVAASLIYPDWLKRQTQADQIEVLGRGRWELWKAGQLDLHDMIDQGGRPLRLDELREAA